MAVADPDAFDRSLDADMQQRLLLALHHRIPGLSQHGNLSGLSGLYTVKRPPR